MYLYNTLAYSAICSTLMPLILLLVKFKALPTRLKVLGLLLLISFVTDLICLYMAKHFLNTHPLFHFYTFIEGLLICIYYYLSFKSKTKQYLVFILGLLCISACVVNAYYDPGLQKVNSLALAVRGGVLVTFSVLLLIEYNNKLEYYNVIDNSTNWLNAAFLIYGALPLFCDVFYYTVENNIIISLNVWAIYLFTDIFYHLLLSFGIWKHKTISQS